jgi:hypothetical protein
MTHPSQFCPIIRASAQLIIDLVGKILNHTGSDISNNPKKTYQLFVKQEQITGPFSTFKKAGKQIADGNNVCNCIKHGIFHTWQFSLSNF